MYIYIYVCVVTDGVGKMESKKTKMDGKYVRC